MSPWERRERGGLYYTRSRKEGGRVVREYVGAGEVAEAIAHADETIRRVREEQRERGRAFVDQAEGLAAPILELCDAADALLRVHLVAAGFHRHKGEWRLRRG